jgi:hypothetical protein
MGKLGTSGGLIQAQDTAVCLTFGRNHVTRYTEAAGLQDQARNEEVSEIDMTLIRAN